MTGVLPAELDHAHLAVPRISEIGSSLRLRRCRSDRSGSGGKFVASDKPAALNARGAKIQGIVALDRASDTEEVFSAQGVLLSSQAQLSAEI